MSGEFEVTVNGYDDALNQLKWALGRIKELEEERAFDKKYIEDCKDRILDLRMKLRAVEEYRSEQIKGRDDV
jgi:hypothetical protein